MAYDQLLAKLYDSFHADKPYATEAAFISDIASDHGVDMDADVLDMACGTGRHLEAFSRQGRSVAGIDQSAFMVEQAAARVPSAHLTVGDLENVRVGRAYPIVTCLFDSIGYLVTNDRIIQGLTSIRDHLEPSGVAILEFWHAAAMLRSHDPVRVRWIQADGMPVLRVSETSLDVRDQTATVKYTIVALEGDRPATVYREEHVNRYFLVQEMALLLAMAGLSPVSWHDGFRRSAAVHTGTWHVVVVATRGRTG